MPTEWHVASGRRDYFHNISHECVEAAPASFFKEGQYTAPAARRRWD